MLLKAAPTYKSEKVYETERITEHFTVTDVTENYFVMDNAAYGKDGINFSTVQNVQKIFEELLREDYKGKVYIKQSFVLNDKMPLTFICERNRFEFIKVNGTDISLKQSDFDIYFKEADVTQYVKTGKNEIVYCIDYFQHDGVAFALFDKNATESLRNCLYYDTHVENTYLKGDFIVNADMTIEQKKITPNITSELYKKGYPFFKGVLTLKGKYRYDGEGERRLSLDKGRFLVAEIVVNGIETDMIFDTETDITRYLKKGENQIEIRLRSSLRNLFGPHHSLAGKDVEGITNQFTFRGQWNGEKPSDFTPEYHFVPFGVDEIIMKKTVI